MILILISSWSSSPGTEYKVAVLVLSAPKNLEKRQQIRKLQLPGCHLQVSNTHVKKWTKLIFYHFPQFLFLIGQTGNSTLEENLQEVKQHQEQKLKIRHFSNLASKMPKLYKNKITSCVIRKQMPTTTCCVSLWKKAIGHFPGNILDPTFCLRKEIFDCSHLYIFCSGRHLVDSVSFSTSFPTTTLYSSSMMTLKSGSFIKDTQSIFKSWPQIETWRTKMTLFQLGCSGLGVGRASSLAAVHSLLLSAQEHNTPQVH